MVRAVFLLLGITVGAPAAAEAPTRLATADAIADLRAQQQRTNDALARRAAAAAAAARAAAARDAAAARVTRLKQQRQRTRALDDALRAALQADEAAAAARSVVAGADAVVAREGARLLRLYDAALAERRRAIDTAPPHRRAASVDAWRQLAAQRDAVRKALAPVLAPAPDDAAVDVGADLDVEEDDDVEALLEKADLARDLEARLRRRAEAVRARIAELQEEAAVAADVSASIARDQLFDEEDRRLIVNRGDLGVARPVGLGDGPRERADDARPPAPPSSENGSIAAPAPQDAEGDRPALSLDPTPTSPEIGTTTPSSAERAYVGTTVEAGWAPGRSLAELQALERALDHALRVVAAKQAALKKAAAERAQD